MNTRELISSLSLIVRDLETAAAEHGIDYTAIVREARQLLRRGKAPLVQLRALNARLLGVRMRLAAQYICSGSDITPEISTRYADNISEYQPSGRPHCFPFFLQQ